MTPEIALLYRKLAARISTIAGEKIKPHVLIAKALTRYYANKVETLNYQEWKKEIFEEVYRRDLSQCYWCIKKLLRTEVTLDHLVPTSRGGSPLSKKNVVVCCVECNQDKGSLTDEEYRYKLAVKKI